MNEQGLLLLEGWAGRTETPVEVVGQTEKKYRIRAITETRLAGRYRWLAAGETTLVPKHAVRITSACTPTGTHGATDNQSHDTRASG